MLAKILTLVMAFLFLGLSNAVSAEPQEFSAEGEYRLGDSDNRQTAKMAALADAKRKIIEQVGVYVESYSQLNDFELTQDQINTAANALIKIKSEDVSFHENGTLCRALVVAIVDTENIDRAITTSTKKTLPADTPPVEKLPDNDLPENKPQKDKSLLKIAGFDEYDGHYYKIFNDSMTWQQANKRCRELGGHLVTITTKGEQAFVQSILFMRGTKNFYWTAGFRIEGNNWGWLTREEFSYTNWGKGEPNNDLGNEFIIAVSKSGAWLDCPAEGVDHIPDLTFLNLKNSGFICEWESFEDISEQ